ncbi:hypothetical protein OKW43_007842 [Paraburkholderia sp. WC7.3g]
MSPLIRPLRSPPCSQPPMLPAPTSQPAEQPEPTPQPYAQPVPAPQPYAPPAVQPVVNWTLQVIRDGQQVDSFDGTTAVGQARTNKHHKVVTHKVGCKDQPAGSIDLQRTITVSPLRADPTGSVLAIEAQETLESDTQNLGRLQAAAAADPGACEPSGTGRAGGSMGQLANRRRGSFTAVPGAREPRAAVRAALTGSPARPHQTALKHGPPSTAAAIAAIMALGLVQFQQLCDHTDANVRYLESIDVRMTRPNRTPAAAVGRLPPLAAPRPVHISVSTRVTCVRPTWLLGSSSASTSFAKPLKFGATLEANPCNPAGLTSLMQSTKSVCRSHTAHQLQQLVFVYSLKSGNPFAVYPLLAFISKCAGRPAERVRIALDARHAPR